MSSQDVLPFLPTPSASIAGRTMQESTYQQRLQPRRLPEESLGYSDGGVIATVGFSSRGYRSSASEDSAGLSKKESSNSETLDG